MLLFFDELTDEDMDRAGGKDKSLAMPVAHRVSGSEWIHHHAQTFVGGEIIPALWERVVETDGRLRGSDTDAPTVRIVLGWC